MKYEFFFALVTFIIFVLMGLVDYGSDSSDDEQEIIQEQEKEIKKTAEPTKKGFSLPPPKNKGSKKFVVENPIIDEDELGITKQDDDEPQQMKRSGMLSSFLPAPKNTTSSESVVTEEPKEENNNDYRIGAPLSRKNRTLGGGIKSQFDGEIAIEESYTLNISRNDKPKSVKIVPAHILALRAKYGDDYVPHTEKVKTPIQSPQTSQPLQPDDPVKPKVKLPTLFTTHKEEDPEFEHTAGHRFPTVDVAPGKAAASEASETVAPQVSEQTSTTKRKRDDAYNVVEFDVNEFYGENEQLRAQGKLEEDRKGKVHAIGSGRHQLSSIISSAQQNKEGLEQVFAENKRRKAEAKKRFGF